MKNIIFGIIGAITFYSCSVQQPQIIQTPKWYLEPSCPAEHICGVGSGKSFETSLINALGIFSDHNNAMLTKTIIEDSDTFNQELVSKSDLMIGTDLYFTNRFEQSRSYGDSTSEYKHETRSFKKLSLKNDTMDALIILSTTENDLAEFNEDVNSNYFNCSIDNIVDYLKINGYNIKTEELNGYFFCNISRLREQVK